MSSCILSTFQFYFLFLLLLLLAFCSLFELVCTAESSVPTKTINLFTPENIKKAVLQNSESTLKSVTVESFENIFLVAANDFMVALAETKIKKDPDSDDSSSNNALNLVAEYIVKKKEEKWGGKFTNEDGTNWETKIIVNGIDGTQKEIFSNKKGSAVVTKDNMIYFFVVRCETPDGNSELGNFIKNLKFAFVIGEVKDKSIEGQDKIIDWKFEKNVHLASSEDIIKQSADKIKNKISSIASVNCFVFLTAEEKRVVFVIKGKFENDDHKNIILFFELEKSTQKTLELFHVEIVENCDITFFQSKDKVLMIPTGCNSDSNLEIKESTNMKDWTKSNSLFSCLLDSLKDKIGLITEIIDGKPILFLTQKKNEGQKFLTYLWISDGTRMTCVGEIVSKDQKNFDRSLLYTNAELFALYKKTISGVSGIGTNGNKIEFKHFKEVGKKINSVLDKWEKSNKLVSELCGNDQQKAKISCEQQLPTDGLVGFLSSEADGDNEKWEDNYDYLTANVKGGNKITDGFTFSGPGAGAKWPVSDKSNYKLYNFTDSGFTLIATVTIEKMPEKGEDNSVLGVCVNNKGGDLKNCLRLWCMGESNWGVSGLQGADIAKTDKKCDKGSDHVVGLTLEKENKNIVVYVNGEQLSTVPEKSVTVTVELEDVISYFYFGVDTSVNKQDNTESQVSVKNVLLYNQPLGDEKLKKIKPIKVENSLKQVEGAKSPLETEKSNAQIDEESTSGDDTPETAATLLPTEEVVLSTSQRESAVYISISVMCGVWLMLFVVTHYQYV